MVGASRRRLLLALGAATSGSLAGCFGSPERTGRTETSDADGDATGEQASESEGSNASASDSPDPEDLEGHVRPDDDPARVPEPLECEGEDVVRYPRLYGAVAWGDASDRDGPTFSLRVDSLSVALGEHVTVRQTNVSDRTLSAGVSEQYNLEIYTEDGWEEVRAGPDPLDEPISQGVNREPGDRVTWSIELSEESIVEGHMLEDRLTVCPDLQPGRYRFVSSVPTDSSLAVAFDVVE